MKWPDEKAFWEAKYFKVKRIVAAWKDHPMLSAFGKSMLANAMIYSRFRYWAQAMVIPEEIMAAIESDVQQLVWTKSGESTFFDEEELGTEGTFRRWMKDKAQ